MQSAATFSRDGNRVPIQQNGLIVTNSITFTGSNETVAVPVFRLTGSVQVNSLYGVVTTALGSNHTAAYWRLNDQTAQSDITLNTGTTMSSAAAGSILVKKGLATAALTLLTAAQERVSEPTTLETLYFSTFTIVAKPSANTDIEYVYTTSSTPTSGVIKFYAGFIPLSDDGNLVAV